MPETNARIKVCHDTAANFKTNNPTLLVGEWALETDTKKMKIGDGSTAYNSLPYSTVEENNEWVKPEDWVDIRSGALQKSIYLLVGHKADYSAYRYIDFHVVLSDTTHKFKVYIDYNLYGTYISGSDVALDWQTLNLSTGKETTSPEALVTHVIRIVPEDSADTITQYDNKRYGSSGNEQEGILWAHFTQNEMELVKFTKYNSVYQPLLTAITALDDKLYITGTDMGGWIAETQDQYTRRSSYLAKLPVIEVDTLTNFGSMFNHEGPLKKAKLIVNNSISAAGTSNKHATCFASGNIEEIEINKPIIVGNGTSQAMSFFRVSNIKKLPALDFSAAKKMNYFLSNNTKLQDTVLDVSEAKDLTLLTVPGALNSPGNFMGGLKGVIVNPNAPFDFETSPQINVSNTGINRAALVQLFNSMPYNNSLVLDGASVDSNNVLSITGSPYTARSYITAPSSFNKAEVIVKVGPQNNPNSTFPIFVFGSAPAAGGNARVTANVGTNYITFASGQTHFIDILAEDFDFAEALNSGGVYVKLLCEKVENNYVYTLSLSSDGITYVDGTPYTSETNYIYDYLWFLRNSSGTNTKGVVYLNESSAKFDDVIWSNWNTSQMTKTCSVVGCTGTADLTADDKAIATDKGWELTVA